MSVCLVIDNATQLVVNRVVAEPDATPPEGCYLVEQVDMSIDIGWIWDGVNFVPSSGVADGN